MFKKFILCLLSLCLLFAGCDCRRQAGGTLIPIDDNDDFHTFEQQSKALNSGLELLNSLEEHPCLPEMPGAERLIQTADRLNKWIVERPAEPNWKPDESLLALEDSARRCESAARDVVGLLRTLQGRTEGEQSEEPIPSSLEEERKQVVRLLSQLDGELRTFAKLCEIEYLETLLSTIRELKENFTNLDSIANLTPTKVRAFARQWETKTQQFSMFAEKLERLASEFRVEGLFIQPSDIDYLKQRIWTRNISTWARGKSALTLQRAKALFDWTVRNIEIRPETSLPQQYPWQTLLMGTGSAWDRVWIFMELLQEERINSCLLSVPHPENPQEEFYWAVGVLIDDEVYLFLPHHGLPIPGPGGLVLAENGELDYEDIATLSQVADNDSLLRRLDLPNGKFPLNADTAKHSTVHILAAPCAVSHRMKVFEAALDREQSMMLYVDLKEQRRLFGTIPNVDKVELWKYPYRTMYEQLFAAELTTEQLVTFRNPNAKRMLREIKQMQDSILQMQGIQTEEANPSTAPSSHGKNDNTDQSLSEKTDFGLWSGRILYFKGRITGQESAAMSWQDARFSDSDLLELKNQPIFQLDPTMEKVFRLATLNAIYWLGLASYENGSMSAAKDYWESRDISKRNPWSNGVQYMLGRVAEREKDYEKAAALFEQAVAGPSAAGNLLRAQWLRELTAKEE